MNLKLFLEQANQGRPDSKKLYQMLVQNLSTLFVLYIRTGIDRNPFLTRGQQPGQYFVAAFTDQEIAEQVRLEAAYKVECREESVLSFLIKIYRNQYQGLMLNPGHSSRFLIEKKQLQELITEYAVDQLSRMPGAWIPTMGEHMLLVEYQKNAYTVAIYANKEDAELMCEEAGGNAMMHQWDQIFARAKKVKAQSLYLHFHLPEQIYLASHHIEQIWQGPHRGFEGNHVAVHPYQPQVIGAEEEVKETIEEVESPAESLREDPIEAPVIPPKQETKNPPEKMGETKKQEDPQSKEVEAAPEEGAVVQEESRTEERQSEERESHSSKEEKLLPSERVNPYSIKHKKDTEFEIYLGGGELQKTAVDPLDMQRIFPQVKLTDPPGKEDAKQQPDPRKEKEASQPIAKKANESIEKEASDVKQTESVSKKAVSTAGNRGLAPAVREGLERLEKATVEGQGMANGWEVCQVLAEIRRIWIIVDQGANMVILAGQDRSPIVDFFTSDVHAQRLIKEAHQNNPSLPEMTPQLVSTRKLYRALSVRQPIVWINRGSPGAWTSVMGDTLPYVMQLMAQLEKEKI